MENINIKGKITSYKLMDINTITEVEETIIPTDIKLPEDNPARVKVLRAEGKKWYLTVVYHVDSEQPFALFCKTNHSEGTAQTSDAINRLITLARNKGILHKHIEDIINKCKNDSNVGKLTRVISLLLRHGVLVKNIVKCIDQMEDIFIGSFLFQIKKLLSNYIKDGEKVEGTSCDLCGSQLVFSEGCMSCTGCGASKCS